LENFFHFRSELCHFLSPRPWGGLVPSGCLMAPGVLMWASWAHHGRFWGMAHYNEFAIVRFLYQVSTVEFPQQGCHSEVSTAGFPHPRHDVYIARFAEQSLRATMNHQSFIDEVSLARLSQQAPISKVSSTSLSSTVILTAMFPMHASMAQCP